MFAACYLFNAFSIRSQTESTKTTFVIQWAIILMTKRENKTKQNKPRNKQKHAICCSFLLSLNINLGFVSVFCYGRLHMQCAGGTLVNT